MQMHQIYLNKWEFQLTLKIRRKKKMTRFNLLLFGLFHQFKMKLRFTHNIPDLKCLTILIWAATIFPLSHYENDRRMSHLVWDDKSFYVSLKRILISKFVQIKYFLMSNHMWRANHCLPLFISELLRASNENSWKCESIGKKGKRI